MRPVGQEAVEEGRASGNLVAQLERRHPPLVRRSQQQPRPLPRGQDSPLVSAGADLRHRCAAGRFHDQRHHHFEARGVDRLLHVYPSV
jgi:hypothetical protein